MSIESDPLINTPGLTDQEKDLLKQAADLYNGFYDLPDKHPSDMPEMRYHIHAIQSKIMGRVAVRLHPELFTDFRTEK